MARQSTPRASAKARSLIYCTHRAHARRPQSESARWKVFLVSARDSGQHKGIGIHGSKEQCRKTEEKLNILQIQTEIGRLFRRFENEPTPSLLPNWGTPPRPRYKFTRRSGAPSRSVIVVICPDGAETSICSLSYLPLEVSQNLYLLTASATVCQLPLIPPRFRLSLTSNYVGSAFPRYRHAPPPHPSTPLSILWVCFHAN